MTTIQIIDTGNSRSFPSAHPLGISSTEGAKVLLILGDRVDSALHSLKNPEQYDLILVELHQECLGVHTGEDLGDEGSQILGFARYKMGDDPPTQLIELVRQKNSNEKAIALAKSIFESVNLVVAVCADTPGRIVDRLIRPYLNSVLRRLDDGLATAADMDLTLKLGLGYPEGPLEMLKRTGLANHAQVSKYLYEALGHPGFVPARRAQVARQINESLTKKST